MDIREPMEHAYERIPGSQLIPLGELSATRLDELGCDVVLYCRTSRRSAEALHLLAQQGFTRASHLEGGIERWKAAGLDVEKTKGAPRLSLFQQVLLVAGTLVLVGTVLAAFVSPLWLVMTGFVALGQVLAGATGFCPMATFLGKMPWNKIDTTSCAV